MRGKLFSCILALFLIPPALFAQAGTENIEEALGIQNEETDLSPQTDYLEYFSEHPLDLRKAGIRDLARIPGISLGQARRIAGLIKGQKDISYDELADSLNLSSEQGAILRQTTFIESDPAIFGRRLLLRSRLQQGIHETDGSADGIFRGSQLQAYNRMTWHDGDHTAGLVTNKSAGERSAAEFWSGFLSAKLAGVNIIAGDYCIESGMGSILWRGTGAKKGADVSSAPVEYHSRIHPYRSTLEYRFFRGLAAETEIPFPENSSLLVTAWGSSLPRAASLDSSRSLATSLDISGYTRTETEYNRRNAIRENSFGGRSEWRTENFTLGATVLWLNYSLPVESASPLSLRGKSGLLGALHGNYFAGDLTFTGEAARDPQGNTGIKAGMQFRHKGLDATLYLRSFGRDFRSPFGACFGEFSSAGNESGIYGGIVWRAAPDIKLLSYIDFYRSQLPRSGIFFPVRGVDFFSELRMNFTRKDLLTLRFRTEEKSDAERNAETNELIHFQGKRLSFRAEIRHDANQEFSIRLRCEASHIVKRKESGIAGFAEAAYTIKGFLRMQGRISLFSTPGYATAVWQYESLAPGLLSGAVLYGEGTRYYLNVQWTPIAVLTLSGRFSSTIRNNAESLSSGLSEIEGNRDDRLLFQLDMNL